MLLVPYSSMNIMMFVRSPVRIEAIAMTVVTPITMPSTVRKLLNLCARTLSSAILRVSPGTEEPSFTITSVLLQCHDWVESRRLHRRIDTKEHSDNARNDQRKQNIGNCDRHRDWRCRPNKPRDACCEEKSQNAPKRTKDRRLNEKLQQNVTAPRPDCLSQTYLKGPFGHAHKHDVH